jgi:DNA modification methylase
MPMEAQSKRGAVYECGPHRVMCGDSADAGDVATLIGSDIAVMVLADPPYNMGYGVKTARRKDPEHRSPNRPPQAIRDDLYDDDLPVEEYRDFLAECLKLANAASTDDAALHLWFASRRVRAVLEALDRSGWEYRDILIWHKTNATYGDLGAQYKAKFEPFFYAHKRGQSPRWHGASNETTVWEYDKPHNSELHPVMRPVELYERALQNHSHTGDIILDPFAGSGTTMIAAERTGRRAFLIGAGFSLCRRDPAALRRLHRRPRLVWPEAARRCRGAAVMRERLAYTLTITENGDAIRQQPMADPFHTTMIHPKGWRSAWLVLRGRYKLVLSVGADMDRVDEVMRLNHEEPHWASEPGFGQRAAGGGWGQRG